MNLELWEKVYKENIRLDKIYYQKYNSDSNIYEKNCIEFLVELGEFINETKCFKYWSIKEPKYEEVLEELADVLTMLLYFYNVSNSSLTTIKIEENKDLLYLINETYYLGTKLYTKLNKELLDNIFIKVLSISSLLSINEKEIIEAIEKKQRIIEERLNSDY